MKQSIRLTRATLYFKFIAFRDLTSVKAGATPQRMFEKRKRHGETDVKVLPWSQWFFLIFWAFIVHCNASINSNGKDAGKDACSRESRCSWLSYAQLVEVRASPDTLADKARQDVLRSSTVRYRPTSPDFVAKLSEFTAH